MSKIEVIKSTAQYIGDIGNYYGGLLAAKTECGGYAWTIQNYNGESWQLIPESLYIELVKFNSAPIQIGDKVKLNELGVKEIVNSLGDWIDCETLDKLQTESIGIITEITLSDSLFVVELGTATFYLSAGMIDKIGGEL